MITIIDYGLGNVLAFVNVYNRLNIPVAVAKSSGPMSRGVTQHSCALQVAKWFAWLARSIALAD